ncbi:DUF2975 domain-containing protein [Arthrobacter gandavensis]|uniref:DUF2975 domain-containing protein n=1 Tax=Arthrobacter gandavensis TaxID=169960 RepID=UPI00188F329A|nr:DUF2975 domain-containing protein [Arthrobacter gandavensis]MBF4994938.1 DUF2975 domain-containing protein [Arthrobacter gandavensis]
MTQQEALPLRLVLVVLGILALGSQTVLLPRLAGEYATAYPQVAHLAVPYTVAAIAAVVGFEAALLAAWRMLSIVVAEGSLTLGAAGPASLMAVSLGLSGVTLAGICAHAGSVAGVGGPAMLLGLLCGLALVPAAVGLRNRILRAGMEPAADLDGRYRWM